MITLTGKKISEGIAIGKLSLYKRDIKEIKRIYVKDIEKEVARFQKAKDKAFMELKVMHTSSIKEVECSYFRNAAADFRGRGICRKDYEYHSGREAECRICSLPCS